MTSIFSCVFFWKKTYRICWVSSLQSISVPTIGGKNLKALKQRHLPSMKPPPPSIALVQETSNIERTKASIPKRDITSSAVDVFFGQNPWTLGSPPRKQPALIRDYEAHHWYWDMGYPVPLDLGDYTYLSYLSQADQPLMIPTVLTSILEFWIFLSKATPAFWKHDFRMAEKVMKQRCLDLFFFKYHHLVYSKYSKEKRHTWNIVCILRQKGKSNPDTIDQMFILCFMKVVL